MRIWVNSILIRARQVENSSSDNRQAKEPLRDGGDDFYHPILVVCGDLLIDSLQSITFETDKNAAIYERQKMTLWSSIFFVDTIKCAE